MRLRTSLMTSSNVGTRQSKDGGVGATAVCCCRREVSAEIDSCDASISSLLSYHHHRLVLELSLVLPTAVLL